MLVRVLRPIPAGGATLMPGEVHDASAWPNLRDLLAMEYLEPAPAGEPEPQAPAPLGAAPAPETPANRATSHDLPAAPAPEPARKRKR